MEYYKYSNNYMKNILIALVVVGLFTAFTVDAGRASYLRLFSGSYVDRLDPVTKTEDLPEWYRYTSTNSDEVCNVFVARNELKEISTLSADCNAK